MGHGLLRYHYKRSFKPNFTLFSVACFHESFAAMNRRKKLQKLRAQWRDADKVSTENRRQELSLVRVNVSPKSAVACRSKQSTKIATRPIKRTNDQHWWIRTTYVRVRKVEVIHGIVTLSDGLGADLPSAGFGFFGRKWVRVTQG